MVLFEWVYDIEFFINELPVIEVFGKQDSCFTFECSSNNKTVVKGEAVVFGNTAGPLDGMNGIGMHYIVLFTFIDGLDCLVKTEFEFTGNGVC